MNGLPIARTSTMEPEKKEEQQDERRDAAPTEIPEPDTSDYNLPFTD